MKTISMTMKVSGETWEDAIAAFEKAADLPVEEAIEQGLLTTEGDAVREIHIDIGEKLTVTHTPEEPGL